MYITDVWLSTLQEVYLNKGMNHYGYNNFKKTTTTGFCTVCLGGVRSCAQGSFPV